MDVPDSLRRWFVIHALIDLSLAVPLLLAPQLVLGKLGWVHVDPASTRLAAAALLAIGAQSFIGRNEGAAAFTAMLNLKIFWSAAAIFGLVASIGEGAPSAAWVFLSAFIAFFGVWIHYRIRFKQLALASEESGDQAADSPGPGSG